jgi:NAD-dependent DNA ligase
MEGSVNDATYIDGKYLPSIEEVERRNRIRLSIFAYAYEFDDDPLISDAEYDRLSYLIKTDRSTGNEMLDDFFRKHFQSHTGQWIRIHPELDKVRALHFMWKNNFNYKKYWRFGAHIYDRDKQKIII